MTPRKRVPITVAVMTPVVRKLITAIMERGSSRPRPQMPCPLVQPLPIRLPKPTNTPARIIAGVEIVSSIDKVCGYTLDRIKPPKINPDRNVTRHAVSFFLNSKRPPMIPLIPAIRCSDANNIKAAIPKIVPPMIEVRGVKLSIYSYLVVNLSN